MKKRNTALTAALAILFSTSAYAADNKAAVTQSGGNSNTATITQINLTNGSGVIDQVGDNNTATILQNTLTGAPAAADTIGNISQNGIANNTTIQQDVGNTMAYAAQAGNGNGASLQQGASGGFATFNQSGEYNSFVLNQTGMNALSSLSQNGNNNQFTLTQQESSPSVGNQLGDGNIATAKIAAFGNLNIEQQGFGNTTDILQNEQLTNATATVTQLGESNIAYIGQGSFTGPSNNVNAVIVQSGIGNRAFSTDYDSPSSSENTSIITQIDIANFANNVFVGSFSTANIFQDGTWNHFWLTSVGDNNQMSSTQTGLTNRIGNESVLRGNNNTVSFYQNGNSNWISGFERIEGTSIDFSQAGNNNYMEVGMTGNGLIVNSTISMSQNGDENTASIVSPLSADVTAGSINVHQIGFANASTVSQDSSSNSTVQISQSNTALSGVLNWEVFPNPYLSYQTGNNTALTIQSGSYEDIFISQDGLGHTALVDQSGLGIITAHEIVSITQTGLNNSANVSQSGGPGNAVYIVQN